MVNKHCVMFRESNICGIVNIHRILWQTIHSECSNITGICCRNKNQWVYLWTVAPSNKMRAGKRYCCQRHRVACGVCPATCYPAKSEVVSRNRDCDTPFYKVSKNTPVLSSLITRQHPTRNGDRDIYRYTIKSVWLYFRWIAFHNDRCKPITTSKSMVPNGWNRIWYSDVSQPTTVIESIGADRSNGVGNTNRCQSATLIESPSANGGDRTGNTDRCQSTTICECFLSDGGDGAGNSDSG